MQFSGFPRRNRLYNCAPSYLRPEQYFSPRAKTRPSRDIFSGTHRNGPEFNVNDTLNGCTMHQVNFLSYRISKLYPYTLLYSGAGLNNARAPKSWLYFACAPLTPAAGEAGTTYHGVVSDARWRGWGWVRASGAAANERRGFSLINGTPRRDVISNSRRSCCCCYYRILPRCLTIQGKIFFTPAQAIAVNTHQGECDRRRGVVTLETVERIPFFFLPQVS